MPSGVPSSLLRCSLLVHLHGLDPGSANMALGQLPAVINKVLLNTDTHVHVSSVAAFVLQGQN